MTRTQVELAKKAGVPVEDYAKEMNRLIEKKLSQSKQKDRRKLYYSVLNYLFVKGYESEKIKIALTEILGEQQDES